MRWFRWLGRRAEDSDPNEQEARDLLDRYHRRASLTDGNRMFIAPDKVLENITEAVERVDIDINTAISIEEDIASPDELLTLVERFMIGRRSQFM